MTTTTPKPVSASRSTRTRSIIRTIFYTPMILATVGAYVQLLITL